MRGFGLAPDDITPRGEDGTGGQEGQAVHFWNDGSPPGENKYLTGYQQGSYGLGDPRLGHDNDDDDLEWQAQSQADTDGGEFEDEKVDPEDIDFLGMVRDAEALSALYVQQANRRAWTQSYRACPWRRPP